MTVQPILINAGIIGKTYAVLDTYINIRVIQQ